MRHRDLVVRAVGPADRAVVSELLGSAWGGTTVVAHDRVYDAAGLPGLLAERRGEPVGLLTYEMTVHGMEIVTLAAVGQFTGVGTALLSAAADVARQAGVPRIWLVTTNDNLDALRFYQRRGLRIVAVDHGAVDRARTVKPTIPVTGSYGIPLHDELTLELRL